MRPFEPSVVDPPDLDLFFVTGCVKLFAVGREFQGVDSSDRTVGSQSQDCAWLAVARRAFDRKVDGQDGQYDPATESTIEVVRNHHFGNLLTALVDGAG